MVRRKISTNETGQSATRSRSRRPRAKALQELADEYMLDRKYQGLAQKTLYLDRWALSKIKLVTDTLPINRATALKILDGDYASTTLENLLASVKRFFQWAEKIHGIPNVLTDFSVKKGKASLPRVLTDDEIQALMKAAKKPVDRALVSMLLNTGVRIAEAASLVKQNIVWHSDRIEIVVHGKTGTRQVPISPEIAEMLTELGDDVHIWTSSKGNPVKKPALQRRFVRIMKRAGLKGPRLGPHTCRHTYGTGFIRRGGDVVRLKALMGHTDIAMTQKYVTLAAVDLHDAHARFGIPLYLLLGTEPLRHPAPHVTTIGAVVIRVDEQWTCEALDLALLER